MTYQEILDRSRDLIGPYCKSCKICNGQACKNTIPGPGAKGLGNGLIRSYQKWQELCVNMDTICENGPADTTFDFFGHKLALPVMAGPVAAMQLPVGDFDKPAIRESAREAGLVNADKSDSQDICFVPDGDYVSFLQAQGVTLTPGDFVDEAGRVLGRHRGLPCYTIGQGKGLGIAVGKHVYVLAKHEADNTVVLGDNDRLFRTELTANRVNWIAGPAPEGAFRCTAKTRYSQAETPALAEPLPDGRLHLTFDEPQRAVTAGQAVVLYDGEEVLGGGTIE